MLSHAGHSSPVTLLTAAARPLMSGLGRADVRPMSGTHAAETPQGQAVRERATLIAFVVVALVATVAWLGLLGWLAVEGLQALGV